MKLCNTECVFFITNTISAGRNDMSQIVLFICFLFGYIQICKDNKKKFKLDFLMSCLGYLKIG